MLLFLSARLNTGETIPLIYMVKKAYLVVCDGPDNHVVLLPVAVYALHHRTKLVVKRHYSILKRLY
jgi:hypothetical protein